MNTNVTPAARCGLGLIRELDLARQITTSGEDGIASGDSLKAFPGTRRCEPPQVPASRGNTNVTPAARCGLGLIRELDLARQITTSGEDGIASGDSLKAFPGISSGLLCGTSGQATLEFVIATAGVILPVTLMVVFTAQLLWVWNSAIEWTRDGARYAATHCWQGGGENVLTYMRTHVPPNIDQDQFTSGSTEITVTYYSRNTDSGALDAFTCEGGECSAECVPDAVRVSIGAYSYRNFMSYVGLPPVAIPEFATALPMESAGCDPDQGTCLP